MIRVDLDTGAVTRFDGCLGHAACRAYPDVHLFVFGLPGNVLSSTGRCTRDDGVIDLTTGETRRVPERILGAAGRYAVHLANDDTIVVSDWRTGATISRVDDVTLSPVASRSTRTARSPGRRAT